MKFCVIIILVFLFLKPTQILGQETDSVQTRARTFQVDTLQQKRIFVTVTDNEGIPLPSVSITIKGELDGTVTNLDGNYSILAKEGDILVFSVVGFTNKEVQVGTEVLVDVIFDESDLMDLEPVLLLAIAKSEQEESKLIPCLNAERLVGPRKYDSRFENYQLDSLVVWQSSILKKSESVAIIIEKDKLYEVSDSKFQLDISNKLGRVYNLCSDQVFTSQPVIGTGTGFVVGSNSMITAKHVFERSIEDYAVVFGYELTDKLGNVQRILKSSNIFYPKIVEYESDELDIVKFSVDRPFDRPILEWENSRDLNQDDEIYMIGHPSGLPQKIALNAEIVDNSKFQYFYTSLDGFQGNSGSPIFNLCNNRVIGVLVSGELDYEYNGSCYETTLCKYPYCKGEKVIRIETIMRDID